MAMVSLCLPFHYKAGMNDCQGVCKTVIDNGRNKTIWLGNRVIMRKICYNEIVRS